MVRAELARLSRWGGVVDGVATFDNCGWQVKLSPKASASLALVWAVLYGV
jgi:hypothetical protein